MAVAKNTTIVWGNDETGREKTPLWEKTVFRPRKAITRFCLARAKQLAILPQPQRINVSLRGPMETLQLARPQLRQPSPQDIHSIVDEPLLGVLANKTGGDDVDDANFITALGNSRDWKSGCAICLTDNIMGTTCGCGHTETAIFRPCGHAVCMRPCFVELMAQRGHTLEPKTMKFGDQTFVVGSEVDPSSAPAFPCPLCRSTVSRVFQAEEVLLTDFIPESVISNITDELYQKFANESNYTISIRV